MNKSILALGVAAALTAGASMASHQDSASLTVTGEVDEHCTLALVDGFSFDIENNQDMQKVAEVTAWCNTAAQEVEVRYAPQTTDGGGNAAFHDGSGNYIRFSGEVTPPGGATPHPINGAGPFDVDQLNGSPSDVEIRSAYQLSDPAGQYATTIDITVMY